MRNLLGAVAVVALLAGAGCAGAEPADKVAASGDALMQAPLASGCGTRFVATTGDASSSNDCRAAGTPCAAIGHAITVACAGDDVLVGPGTFVENVVVDKALSLSGSGPATVVVPATSSPNPCSDSSLCGGAATSVILVSASNVTIERLAVDGDNPALTSGTLVGGVDVDARNGIITDDGAPLDGLSVHDVAVRNVYLRGIDASSGGTFRIVRSRVTNVSSDPEAIGIFNTGGSGAITDNTVTDASTGIASNFSSGVQFLRNHVSRTAEGIHTDNAGGAAGSTADLVQDNVITDCTENGYGAFVFVPSLGVTFRANRIAGCTVGMAAFGEGADVQSRFLENWVDGKGAADSVGLYVTTSQVGFGSNDVHVLALANAIDNAGTGVALVQETGFVTTADVECNVFDNDTEAVVDQSSASTVTNNVIVGSGARPSLLACALKVASAK